MHAAVLTGSLGEAGGGVAIALDALLGQMTARGRVQCTVIGIRSTTSESTSISYGSGCVQALSSYGPASLCYSPLLAKSLLHAAPDLAHSHGLWMWLSLVVSRWSTRSRRPYLVSPHGMLDPWALANSYWKKRAISYLYENRHLEQAACIHSLNQSETQSVRTYGLRQPIAQLPNGVDLPDQRSCRNDDNPTVVFLGRIHPKKGLKELISAWAATQRDSPNDWRLVIAGWDDGGYADGLQQQARDLGVDGSVEFVGPKFDAEKEQLLREASAFILPSFSEGLPMAVLEAWSYGLPVVMTDHCNLPEGFQADAALRVEPRPDSISDGLRELFSMSDADLAAMGGRGRSLVEERFTWPEIARQMIEVYEWVLGGGPPPACVVRD